LAAIKILLIATFIYLIVKDTPFVIDGAFITSSQIGSLIVLIVVISFFLISKILISKSKVKVSVLVSVLSLIVSIFIMNYLVSRDFARVHYEHNYMKVFIMSYLIVGYLSSIYFIYKRFFKLKKPSQTLKKTLGRKTSSKKAIDIRRL